MKQTIVITGANGLLGRKSLELLSDLYELHAIVHRDPVSRISGVTYYAIDLASDWSTSHLPDKADAIIHLAQSSQFRNFPDSALDVFRVNIESTAKLLDYARRSGASRFVYTSSGGVYGTGGVAFTENSPIAPPGQLGCYLGSKMCSEILSQSYASLMHIVVLRPFFIYGPFQNRTMLIPRLMDNVASGRPVSLQGDDGVRINPIHVQDASAAVIAALSLNHSATFNIAGPDVLSIREICEGMGSYLGRAPIFQFQPSDPQDLIGDNSAMCEQLIFPQRKILKSLADVSI
jgi:UDP-glucose 4-epimerase